MPARAFWSPLSICRAWLLPGVMAMASNQTLTPRVSKCRRSSSPTSEASIRA